MTLVEQQSRGDIVEPTLVVGEGARDASFIHHLTTNRGLQGIQVAYPEIETAQGTGASSQGRYLEGLRTKPGFKEKLRNVIVMRDADTDPAVSFADVIEQLQAVEWIQHLPIAPNERSAGNPTITVRIIPNHGEQGNLDSLLLGAIKPDHPLLHCFEPYFACCGLEAHPLGVVAKVKLATIVAASCPKNPGSSLVFIWSKACNPIRLDSPQFNDLVEFLRSYSTPHPD